MEQVIHYLLRLVNNHGKRGFGFCFLYLLHKVRAGTKDQAGQTAIRRASEPLTVQTRMNQVWSMAFMHDQLVDRHSIRVLNVIDDFNRQAWSIKVGLSRPLKRVIPPIKQIIGNAGNRPPFAAAMS